MDYSTLPVISSELSYRLILSFQMKGHDPYAMIIQGHNATTASELQGGGDGGDVPGDDGDVPGDDGDVPDLVHLVAQLGSDLDPKCDT